MERQEALSRVLHGGRNHADLHNPITFEVDYPSAGQFIVDVERATPEGATLIVTLDGKPALSQDFPRTAPDQHRTRRTEEQSQSYAVEVSAGAHTITIENTGVDWLYATYRLTNYLAAPNVHVCRAGESAGGTGVGAEPGPHVVPCPQGVRDTSAGGGGEPWRPGAGRLPDRAMGHLHGPPGRHDAVPLHRWTRGDRDSSGPGERRGL